MKSINCVVKKLKKIMDEKKITVYQLSKRTNIERTSLYKIFNGTTKDIMFLTLINILDALDYPMGNFFDDKLMQELKKEIAD